MLLEFTTGNIKDVLAALEKLKHLRFLIFYGLSKKILAAPINNRTPSTRMRA